MKQVCLRFAFLLIFFPTLGLCTFQADPSSFRFIHETITPYLTKKGQNESRTSLLKLVKQVEDKKLDPLSFPAIKIFTIEDPKTHEIKRLIFRNK